MTKLAAIAMAAFTCLAITSVHATEVIKNKAVPRAEPSAAVADAKVCGASLTEEACATTETVHVEMGIVGNVMRLDSGKNFTTLLIGDPAILDLKLLPDHRSFILHGVHVGHTNILFLDENNNTLKNLDVVVRDSSLNVRDENIKIFNRPRLGETDYRCTEVGCKFVYGTPYELPAQVFRHEGTPQIEINQDQRPGPPSTPGGN